MKKCLLLSKIVTFTVAIGILLSTLDGEPFIKAHAMVAFNPNDSFDPHSTTASASYQIQSGDYYYDTMPDGTIRITSYSGFDNELILPDTLDGKSVSTLGSKMFYYSNNRDSITKIVIPEGVTDIDRAAFFGCSSLTEVSLPNTLQTIRDGAFYNCANLSEISIPSNTTEIESGVFCGTKWLSDRIDENPMVVINNILIDGSTCSGDVVIPENVTKISGGAFPNSDNILSITIPDSVVEFGSLGFIGSYSLSEMGEQVASVRTSTDKLNLTIYCNAGSPAEQYAIENKLEYQILDNSISANTDVTDSTETNESILSESSSETDVIISVDESSSESRGCCTPQKHTPNKKRA